MNPLISPARFKPAARSGSGAIEFGITQLINGQAYIDVVLVTTLTDTVWDTVCSVVNTDDPTPLNIWPGIITAKSTTGFTVQLNGMPDSDNYFLHWAIIPGAAAPVIVATTYLFSGPGSGSTAVVSTPFTVHLPSGQTVPTPVTITPGDAGAGGTFAPATVNLTNAAPSATFTYTPASGGSKTISTTNSGGLSDPASLTFTVVAPTYTLSGPSTGAAGAASTPFSVTLSGAVVGTLTVTPHDGGGGGTFTPATVGLTTSAPSATFTYTPASGGAKTISVTNSGGLANPANLTYTATAPFAPTDIAGLQLWLKADALALSDGAAVATWPDSSTHVYNLAATGSEQPTFKTAIVNGKPVVRFNGTTNRMYNAATFLTVQPDTIFFVAKATGTADWYLIGDDSSHIFVGQTPTNNIAIYAGGSVIADAVNHSGAFHVFTGIFNGGSSAVYVDGTSVASGSAGTNQLQQICVMSNSVGSPSAFSPGDIAEIIIYNTALSPTDRASVTNYLKTKYAIP